MIGLRRRRKGQIGERVKWIQERREERRDDLRGRRKEQRLGERGK